jgi:predicted nucleotidyltransferase
MKTKDEYIAALKQFKQECASKYGIRSIGIFGSVARGEHRPDSDVDVFVELEDADPFVMFDLREALQVLFGCKVDLIRLRQGLRSLLLKRIEQDGVYA